MVGYEACGTVCVAVGTCPTGCMAGYEACGSNCVPAGTCGTGGGGTPGTGGTPTGGMPIVQVTCNDSSGTTGALTTAYGSASLAANGGKSYYIHANWWGGYDSQRIQYTGLSFGVNTNTPNDGDSTPAGYPSIYIGSYQGRSTSGSNLPKQVAALTSVPTSFQTNTQSLDTSGFNAAYDVWFTASGSPLANNATSPGAGGAFLMVWLYKPANFKPLGGTSSGARAVPGVPGTWDVFRGTNGGVPCVSYVANPAIGGIETDLKLFIDDAVANNLGVTSNQYLSVIFGGFEIWYGAQNASVNKFCAQVL